MMTRRMRRRVKSGEMLIKWKRSILIGFFFSLFPPPRSIRWTVFLIVDRGNFHEVISLFSDRSDLCVSVCVYTLINLADGRRRQRRSVNKTSFTNVQFIPILNQRLYPPHRLPPGNNKTDERERERERKRGHHHQRVRRCSQFEKSQKKKITARAPVWQCVAASTLTLTRSHGSATPRL